MVKYKSLDFLGYPNYRVGQDGTVWSNYYGYWKKLKFDKDKYGYYLVHLFSNKQRKKKYVHLLVLTTFVGSKPSDLECRHLNGIKTDNRLVNLKWGTRTENSEDRALHGSSKGVKNPLSKLKENQIIEIRALYKTGVFTQRILGQAFNVSQSEIFNIVKKKTWNHI